MNFVKSIVKLHYLCIFSILAKFQSNQGSIDMSSINYLNSIYIYIYIYIFSSLKYCIKDDFLDQMVYNIRLT